MGFVGRSSLFALIKRLGSCIPPWRENKGFLMASFFMPATWNNGMLEQWNNGQKRITSVFGLRVLG